MTLQFCFPLSEAQELCRSEQGGTIIGEQTGVNRREIVYWEQAALTARTSYLVEQTGADGSSQVLGKENIIEDCRGQYQSETLKGKRLWVRWVKRQGRHRTGDKGQRLLFGRTHPSLLQLEVSLAILVSSASLLSLGVAINSRDKLCTCPAPPPKY